LLPSFNSSLLLAQLRGRGYSIRAPAEGNKKNVGGKLRRGESRGQRIEVWVSQVKIEKENKEKKQRKG